MRTKNQISLTRKTMEWTMLLKRNATLRLISITIIVILFLGNSFPVSATTPEGSYGVSKPENLVIYLPWANDVSALANGNDYGALGSDHTGNQYFAIDFNLQPNNTGMAVHPARPGYVIYADDWTDSGFGNTVIIRHDIGDDYYYYSQYAHLANLWVTGNRDNPPYVNLSQILGNEGTTGISTAPHLHFSITRCYKNTNIWSGNYPSGLLNDHTNCVSVVPEPFIGREVYEGFGLSTNWPGPLFGKDLGIDTVPGPPSSARWGSSTTSNNITINSGQTIKFSVENLPSDTKEVRFTVWYHGPNPNNDGWSTMAGDSFNQNWRILDRCWPGKVDCLWGLGQSSLEYTWDPYSGNYDSDAPWLPSGIDQVYKAYKEDGQTQTQVCISFDVFDNAGNVAYAPAGVQCSSISAASESNLVATLGATADSARLIYINPVYSQATDNVPPTGYWTSPGNEQTISSSTVTLSVNASDNAGGSGVREVRWAAKYSGQWYGIGTDYDSPYSTTWDWCMAGVQNGDVELGFEVWDNANNKWVYSENGNVNIHINKNYNCDSGSGGSTNWSTHFYNGMDHWWNTAYTGGEMCNGSFSQGNLDQNYGDGSPCSGGATDNWVGDYKGTVNFLPGNYAFWVDHDDWLKLFIDNQEVYSVNGVHSQWVCPSNGYINLSGNHNIWVILAEQGGQARVKVEWSKNNGVCDLPDAFNKSSPLNGSGGQSTNPILSWGAASGANSYSYCIDTTNNNSCESNWLNVGSATSVNLSGLNPGTTYYWQVKAYSQGGAGTEANSGTWWSFTSQANPPGTFNKVSPTNASNSQPTSLILNWTASTGTSWYQYCYDTTNDNICANDMWFSAGTDTSAYITNLAESTTYYWQVRASNGGGTTYANGSAWWSFSTESNTPIIKYVKPGGLSSGTCDTWANACELRYSLSSALPKNEIWVAAGTYKPTSTTDRNISFVLKNRVGLYGGFSGTEVLRNQRDPATNITILSGDIGVDGNADDNSYHVVIGSGTNSTAVLNGFTITAGNANGTTPNDLGGGMYNNSGSPTLTNVIFNGNTAGAGGGMYNSTVSNLTLTNVTYSANIGHNAGGLFNDHSNLTLSNVTFNGNVAGGNGGAMGNEYSTVYISNATFINNINNHAPGAGNGGGMLNNHSNLTIVNALFEGNTTNGWGGGISNFWGTLTLTRVTFNNNTAIPGGGGLAIASESTDNILLTDVTFAGNAAGSGGGMSNTGPGNAQLINVTFSNNTANGNGGGGMSNEQTSPTLINVTFNGNIAAGNESVVGKGGGIYNYVNADPTLINVTFSNNTAGIGGGMYSVDSNNIKIYDSIFWGNGTEIVNSNSVPLINDSVVQGGCTAGNICTNIINADPMLDLLANNGGYTQTFALLSGSSAIDTGNDATCVTADQRGITRPQGAHCDIGSYEVATFTLYLPLILR